MNNILTFEDYKKMNIKQIESVIFHQFIEDDIQEDIVNEGIIRRVINKRAGNFIHAALADEIEKGKELEQNIKKALDGLNKGFEEIEKKSNTNSKTTLNAIESVKEAIKSAQTQTFDTLTMIGSEGEIDFAGFVGSATVAAAANIGIILTPIRSLFITRKAYKYFLGIIKQTIRRNLLIIQLNFDQFENLILQKSFETDNDSEIMTMSNTLHEIIATMQQQLCKDGVLFKSKSKQNEMSKWLKDFRTTQDALIKNNRESDKRNPLSSLWSDQHNNTYTRTLEQIKQYINEDSQKELDALKNSITKIAGNNADILQFGELMISAAEEYAIITNHGINNNFIKMSSVFNLDNQKKLIDLIVETQNENEEAIKKKQTRHIINEEKRKLKKSIKDGKRIYEEKLKDHKEKYTFDKFDEIFSDDDIKCLKAFFQTNEGKDAYKDLIEKDHIYKYLIDNDITLNTLLTSIGNLKVIEMSDIDDFCENVVKKDQILYYMMANRSIKDAIESTNSEEYFGFEGVKDIADGTLDPTDEDNKTKINKILVNNLFPSRSKSSTSTSRHIKTTKKRYFLTFNSSGEELFDILHNDFKTEIFDSKKEYVKNISTENKENILKLIYKRLNFGKSIISQLSEYLVRLEAHMLLEKKDPWFIVENNNELKDCFIPTSNEILNKNAFVEIREEDYEDIKNFLTKYHSLSDNDFIIDNESKENK
jgi:hypothetical protein